jgi:MFS family permease
MTRDLLLMAIALFTWGIGEGMFLIFQSIYLEQWGADPLQIGAILGSMGIAMTVAQAPAGYLSDRVGSRPIMWASWILGTIAAAMMAFAGSLSLFIIGLLTYGLTSFVVAPMNSYITSVRGTWSVERALTVVSAMFHLGAVGGPIIGGLIAEAVGLQNVYRISTVIFLVSTLIVLMARRPPVEEEESVEILKQRPNLLRNPRFIGLLVLIFFTMLTLYLPQPLTPNYLQNQQQFSLRTIGQLGAMGSFGNAVLMLTLGHLSAPVGFLVGQAFLGLFALFMWQGQGTYPFFIGYFFIGGYRLSRSMALAYARSLVRANEVGFAFGLVETGNAISAIVAPPLAGYLYTRSPELVYIVTTIAVLVMIVVNFLLLPKKTSRQEEMAF